MTETGDARPCRTCAFMTTHSTQFCSEKCFEEWQEKGPRTETALPAVPIVLDLQRIDTLARGGLSHLTPLAENDRLTLRRVHDEMVLRLREDGQRRPTARDPYEDDPHGEKEAKARVDAAERAYNAHQTAMRASGLDETPASCLVPWAELHFAEKGAWVDAVRASQVEQRRERARPTLAEAREALAEARKDPKLGPIFAEIEAEKAELIALRKLAEGTPVQLIPGSLKILANVRASEREKCARELEARADDLDDPINDPTPSMREAAEIYREAAETMRAGAK